MTVNYFARREFKTGDAALFAALTGGLVGLECWRASPLYAGALALDFGDRVLVPAARPKAVHQDRGSFVVVAWACDLEIRAAGSVVRSEVDTEDDVARIARSLVGHRVTVVRLLEGDLSLTLTLDDGAECALVTSEARSDVDQWFLQLPTSATITVRARRCWSISR